MLFACDGKQAQVCHESRYDLTAEDAKQEGAEAVKRDAKEDEGKTDQGTGHAVKKGIFDITQTV